jgi:hypothetical protein
VKYPEYRVLVAALPQLQAEMDEAGANSRLQYADQTEVRNFSNEKAVQAEIPATIDLEGTPYIPSGSFTVSPVADTLITDVLLRNKMLALLSLGKIKTDELKARIHSEIDLQQKALRQLEKENQQLLKQKTLQPAARKFRMDVQKRKDAIRMLIQQVQVLNGEIIII